MCSFHSRRGGKICVPPILRAVDSDKSLLQISTSTRPEIRERGPGPHQHGVYRTCPWIQPKLIRSSLILDYKGCHLLVLCGAYNFHRTSLIYMRTIFCRNHPLFCAYSIMELRKSSAAVTHSNWSIDFCQSQLGKSGCFSLDGHCVCKMLLLQWVSLEWCSDFTTMFWLLPPASGIAAEWSFT